MSPHKILVIDDDAGLQWILKKRLEANNCACDPAFSVEEGLRKIRERSYDLVILDLGFHGVNGTFFLKCMKEGSAGCNGKPPVVVLSGFSDRDIVDYVLGLGAAQFLSKPYDPASLLAAVKRCVP